MGHPSLFWGLQSSPSPYFWERGGLLRSPNAFSPDNVKSGMDSYYKILRRSKVNNLSQ